MAKLLVLAETLNNQILLSSFPAITFAQEFSSKTNVSFSILVISGNAEQLASQLQGYGAESVIAAQSEALTQPLADRYASITAQAAKQIGANYIAAPSSTFGKDILPRAAALLDAAMLTDVLSFELMGSEPVFKRPVYAGNVIATVQIEGEVRVLGIRPTAYGAPLQSNMSSNIETIDLSSISGGAKYISLESGKSERPDLSQAKVVVTGGRPLQNWENFEKYIGGLADTLGGAIGATRAVVDAGIAPNELQVGQTGKIVAPNLYIAAGVSGSIQHMAGIKDSKFIVAINKDPDAPIFEVADYGIVADLYQAIPEMIETLKKR